MTLLKTAMLAAALWSLSATSAAAQDVSYPVPVNEDVGIGRLDAPVAIIEYLSYQCPDCRAFTWDVLPTLQRELIATGKARYIRRHAPVSELAIKGAMIVACAPANTRYALDREIELLQHVWANHPDEADQRLLLIALAYGMDAAKVIDCYNNPEAAGGIVRSIADAAELDIDTFPVFYLMGKSEALRFAGPVTYDTLAQGVTELSRP